MSIWWTGAALVIGGNKVFDIVTLAMMNRPELSRKMNTYIIKRHDIISIYQHEAQC